MEFLNIVNIIIGIIAGLIAIIGGLHALWQQIKPGTIKEFADWDGEDDELQLPSNFR